MAFVFADFDKEKEGDEWWQIAGGIEGFNENRRLVVLADIKNIG